MIISLVPEADHSSAYVIGPKTETPLGKVQVTTTCRIQIGDVYLTIEEAYEFERTLLHARGLARRWRDHITGRAAYKVTREGGEIFCEHMGNKGRLRPSKLRRERACSACRKPALKLWVPADNRSCKYHLRISAELCALCVSSCTVDNSQPLRAVKVPAQ